MATQEVVPAGNISRRTTRRLRNRLIPLLFALFLVAFLDRTNLAFAALTMNADLAITSTQFGIASGIFFLGYALFEIPSNLVLHRIGARGWIARILVTWGIFAMLSGFVHNAHQLYATRFLLGVAEAGFGPGLLTYLSACFRQREQARMVAFVMAAIPASNLIGAPISGLILDHVHWLGLASWRWLLILEGLPAIVGGIITWFVLPNSPAEAKFLTTEEKEWIMTALAEEEKRKLGHEKLSALSSLTHPRVWHLAVIAFTLQVGGYAMWFWMPQAVKSSFASYSNTLIGILLLVPALAGLAALIVVSRSSDRELERRYHTAVPLIIGALALILLVITRSPWAAIALWTLAMVGLQGSFGPFFSIPGSFLTGAAAASGIALVTTVGALGGFVGPLLVGSATSASGNLYHALPLAGVSFFLSAALILMLPKRSATCT